MLKFIFDTETEVPAALKEYYKESDGKWVLDVEGAAPAAKVDEFRRNNIELKKQLDAFKDIDPKSVADIVRKAAEFDTLKSESKDKIDQAVQARLKSLQEDHQKALDALSAERDDYLKKLSGLQIDQAAISVATELGLRKTAVPDMTSRARGTWRLEEGKPVAYDANGEKIYGRNGEPITMQEWIGNAAKEAPHLFEENSGSGTGGSGKGGSGDNEPNPWLPAHWNVTKQAAIFKADEAKARALAAKAGKTIK